MNIILAESNRYPIGSFLDKVKEGFPRRSILSGNKENIGEILKIVKEPPVFSDYWLVIIIAKGISVDIIKRLSEYNHLFIYVVRNKGELDLLALTLKSHDISYKIVDNLVPPKEVVVSHISKELKVSKPLATYIYNRHKGSLSKIWESIEVLSGLPKVTRKDVMRYTERNILVSYDDLFSYILGDNKVSTPWGIKERVSYVKVLKTLYRYRYGVKSVVKFLVDRFESYLKIYDLIIEGELSRSNVTEYFSENYSNFKTMTEWQFKSAVRSFDVVSYEKLYMLYQMYLREYKEGPTLIGVLSLLRISK